MHICCDKLLKLWCECSDCSSNIPDSKSYRVKEAFSLCCRDPSLSVDRQNTSTDPCLQAGIMPLLIEIFDSDHGPVWSCMPSHCACIFFSGLQVSGHDTALGTRAKIKWTITHNLIELSTPKLLFFFFFWQIWQPRVSFSPFYVLTIDSCCNSLRSIIKTRLILVSSIICSLWKHDFGALLFFCSDNVCLWCVILDKQVKLVHQSSLDISPSLMFSFFFSNKPCFLTRFMSEMLPGI